MNISDRPAYEVNFDGLTGPTHNYGGLSFGNLASMEYATQSSNPKEAALQGLNKMRLLYKLGIKQAVLPPQERPNIHLLRSLGFRGTDLEVIKSAYDQAPDLFLACYSSSSMWAANSATVTPSVDNADNKLHFTVSNLQSHSHRAQEASFTYELFKKLFANSQYFMVHPPIFSVPALSDEGAANHNRFCLEYGTSGINMFVFGKDGYLHKHAMPELYPARQTKAAQEAIVRLHQLNRNKILFAQQNPATIDEGVFHNDVISVVNQNVFIYHEAAFRETAEAINAIKFLVDFPMFFIRIDDADLTVPEAVESYIFNSQIVTVASGDMVLIAPEESKIQKKSFDILMKIKEDYNPIKKIEFVDCRQSMKNGGGPACLRLRVVMTEKELQAAHAGVFITESLLQQLESWILKHYRDHLIMKDLLDPDLLQESRNALDELTTILKIGSIYPFQQI